jgi:hypothetical protein
LSLVKTTSVLSSRPQHRADALVHVVDHAAVGVDVAACQVEQRALDLQPTVATRLPRPVRRGVVQAEEQRRVVARRARDPVHHALRDEVGEVALLGLLGLALPQVVPA